MVIAAVVVVAAVGVFFMVKNGGVQVDAAEVSKQPLAVTVLASGSVTAGESRDVYPQTQGLVKDVAVKDGASVRAGDVLATLDNDALSAQLAQAKAGLAQAQSGLAQAQTGSATASSGVAAAKASLSAAETGLSAANTAYKSAKKLSSLSKEILKSSKSAVAAMEATGADKLNPAAYAQAKSAVTQAEVSYEQAKSGVSQAKAGVAQSKAGVAQAKSAVKQAQAADPNSAVKAAKSGVSSANEGVALAKKAVDNTVITAPISGTVIFAPSASAMAAAAQGGSAAGSELSKGSAVTPGSPVFTIVNPKKLSFTVEVDEADIPQIVVGQTATIELDSFSGKEYTAQVSNIGTSAKSTLTGGTIFDVELTFDAPDEAIKLGMKGDSTIEIETKDGAQTVPIEGLFSEGGDDFVYVITAEGRLKKTTVKVGTTTDTSIEILEGVEPGTKIALAGSDQFADNMKVVVKQTAK
jgi:HlyD family secretion protein